MNALGLVRSLAMLVPNAIAGRPVPARPPVGLPEGRIVSLPGRGETFIRDTGGDGPAVVLLHGWMVTADANFFRQYGPLRAAGYRVIAIDHRGHGRGLRDGTPFRLEDAADDVIALVDTLALDRPILVGYSMGGAITSLAVRRRPDLFGGAVWCATSAAWRDLWQVVAFSTMPVLRIGLALAPELFYGIIGGGPRSSRHPVTMWIQAEVSRGSAVDTTEAGREIGRFDARDWLGELDVPAAVVVTTRDLHVPLHNQRALAEGLGAATFEVDADHFACAARPREFNAALLGALAHVDAAAESAAGAARAG